MGASHLQHTGTTHVELGEYKYLQRLRIYFYMPRLIVFFNSSLQVCLGLASMAICWPFADSFGVLEYEELSYGCKQVSGYDSF